MENKTLAKVGNQTITDLDMNKALQTLPKEQQQQFNTEEGRKKLLEELIVRELYYLEAVNSKMEQEPLYQQQLHEVKHTLLQQYAIERHLKTVNVEEDQCKEYYETHKDQFKVEKQVHAKHILVPEEEQAREIAGEIKEGKPFEEAAKEYSTCPSKERGGDLGFFTKGKMVKEFEDAAFALDVGQLSHIVKTQFGYHLIMVDEIQEAGSASYEQVKDQIEQFLLRQEANLAYVGHADELKKKYSVQRM